MVSELVKSVMLIYQAADQDVARAGPQCLASGRCCRFQEFGHLLFLSNLEAEVLLADAPAYRTPVPSQGCPFQKDNLCTVRSQRPLGCRVFFCDPTYQETCQQITETYLRQLKLLSQELGRDWEYAPLHHFLNKSKGT